MEDAHVDIGSDGCCCAPLGLNPGMGLLLNELRSAKKQPRLSCSPRSLQTGPQSIFDGPEHKGGNPEFAGCAALAWMLPVQNSHMMPSHAVIHEQYDMSMQSTARSAHLLWKHPPAGPRAVEAPTGEGIKPAGEDCVRLLRKRPLANASSRGSARRRGPQTCWRGLARSGSTR